ncbi:MAG: hypothetical protein V1664_05395 [Candidatus Uhrbacteria bacterium]
MGQQLTKQDIFEVVSSVVNNAIEKNNADLLENINNSFSDLEQRMSDFKTDLNDVKKDLNAVKTDLNEVRSDLDEVKADLNGVKTDLRGVRSTVNTQMVTKDYLDQKISELRGDILTTIRKEDNKLGTLTNKLAQRKILPTSDIQEILSMEPFPKVS